MPQSSSPPFPAQVSHRQDRTDRIGVLPRLAEERSAPEPAVLGLSLRVDEAASHQRAATKCASELFSWIEKRGYVRQDVACLVRTVAKFHLMWWGFAFSDSRLTDSQRLSARVEATFWGNALSEMHKAAELGEFTGQERERAIVGALKRVIENAHVRSGCLMTHGLTDAQRTESVISLTGTVRASIGIRPTSGLKPGSTQRERALALQSGVRMATANELRVSLNNELLGASFKGWCDLSDGQAFPTMDQLVAHVTRDVESGALPDKKINGVRAPVEALRDDLPVTDTSWDSSTFELRDVLERAADSVALSPSQRLSLNYLLAEPDISLKSLADRLGTTYVSARKHKSDMAKALRGELERSDDMTFTKPSRPAPSSRRARRPKSKEKGRA